MVSRKEFCEEFGGVGCKVSGGGGVGAECFVWLCAVMSRCVGMGCCCIVEGCVADGEGGRVDTSAFKAPSNAVYRCESDFRW